MPIEVTVPQLGESVTEATLTKWLVKEGDVVQKDQPLAELATDKADSELPSPSAGRIARLLVKEGDVVPVRAAICQIEEGAGPVAGAPTPSTKGDAPVAPAAATIAGSEASNGAGVRPSSSAPAITSSASSRSTLHTA